MNLPIYLDYNATTPLAPAVLDAMDPFLRTHFGNPSSDHPYGDVARQAVADARRQVAEFVGARPENVIFTGGGSEAINMVLKGIAAAHSDQGNHIITSSIEHPAVSQTVAALGARGYQVTTVPVDERGQVDPAMVAAAITDRTILISIMHANNEVGTIQPIREIAALARSRRIFVHTDAAQSAGKIPVSIEDLGVDALTLAAHKLYAPKGIGAAVLRDGVSLEPLVHGAGHEYGRRAGTESVAAMVGFGCAASLAPANIQQYATRVRRLRDQLEQLLKSAVPGLLVNGHPTERLPNTLNAGFPGINAAALLGHIRNAVACSTGSACHAGHAAPSPVLLAMGRSPAEAASALRFSLGLETTEQEIVRAAAAVAEAYAQLRGIQH